MLVDVGVDKVYIHTKKETRVRVAHASVSQIAVIHTDNPLVVPQGDYVIPRLFLCARDYKRAKD